MAGPVRKSPRETQVTTITENKSVSLVEKFALQMGGVDPTKMMATLKATAFRQPAKKQGGDWVSPEITNEQMMALLVVANKYDLNPFIKEIYAFPDKGGIVPIVGVDGWSRMINNHDQFDGIEFIFSDNINWADTSDDDAASWLGIQNKSLPESCTCVIHRKDRTHPTKVTEYLDEVYRPQFTDNEGNPKKDNWGKEIRGAWQTHTRRMLRHKAMIQCARLAFGFTGIHDQDEAERIIEGNSVEVHVEGEQQAKALTDRFSSPEEAMTAASTAAENAVAKRATDGNRQSGEIIDVAPEPETEEVGVKGRGEEPPKPEQEEAPKKKIDIVSNTMNSIISSGSAKEIDEILEAVEEFDIPTAKMTIIKKAAAARKKDL